ncbi:MAG: hypothetical protein Q8L24_00780 [bacterium]|nr:hypothetical protein [bacterium]
MTDLVSKISELLLRNKSALLVGPSDSGKTYWVENELIPSLKQNHKVVLFKDAEAIQNKQGDIFIFDEAETLFDQSFLEELHPDKRPYYSIEYLDRVRGWYKLYAQFSGATLFVISRNNSAEVDNLVQNFKRADWDDRVIVTFKFEK